MMRNDEGLSGYFKGLMGAGGGAIQQADEHEQCSRKRQGRLTPRKEDTADLDGQHDGRGEDNVLTSSGNG